MTVCFRRRVLCLMLFSLALQGAFAAKSAPKMTEVTREEFDGEIRRLREDCDLRVSVKAEERGSEIFRLNGMADVSPNLLRSEFRLTVTDLYGALIRQTLGFYPSGLYDARIAWEDIPGGVKLTSFTLSRDDLGNVLGFRDIPDEIHKLLSKCRGDGEYRDAGFDDFVYEDGAYRLYVEEGDDVLSVISHRFEDGKLKSSVMRAEIPLDGFMSGFVVTVTVVLTVLG